MSRFELFPTSSPTPQPCEFTVDPDRAEQLYRDFLGTLVPVAARLAAGLGESPEDIVHSFLVEKLLTGPVGPKLEARMPEHARAYVTRSLHNYILDLRKKRRRWVSLDWDLPESEEEEAARESDQPTAEAALAIRCTQLLRLVRANRSGFGSQQQLGALLLELRLRLVQPVSQSPRRADLQGLMDDLDGSIGSCVERLLPWDPEEEALELGPSKTPLGVVWARLRLLVDDPDGELSRGVVARLIDPALKTNRYEQWVSRGKKRLDELAPGAAEELLRACLPDGERVFRYQVTRRLSRESACKRIQRQL